MLITPELAQGYMNEALEEASFAALRGEVPIGAVVVHEGVVISKASNRMEETKDCTSHAEILAIRDASKKLGNWRLDNCTLIVSVEPCVMCAGAALLARIGTIIYGTGEPQTGALGSTCDVSLLVPTPPRVIRGVCEEKARTLLREFFQQRRI